MPEISIDKIKMRIPDSMVTTEELLEMCHADKGDVPYLIDDEGNHTVLTPGQQLEVEDGTRFGTVTRFITGGDTAGLIDEIFGLPSSY